MRKIMLLLMLVLCTQLVFAGTITRSFSETDLHPGDTLTVTLDVDVDGETVYLIDEIYPSTAWAVVANGGGDELTTPSHIFWTVLSGAVDTSYDYQLTVPNVLGTHDFIGTYGFEGGIESGFLGENQVTVTDEGEEPPIEPPIDPPAEEDENDDLMVNYVRGKITIESWVAETGTEYWVEVLSGTNAGYVYYSEVGENIPDGTVDLTGNGYYDTLDNVKFNTGAEFMVGLIDYPFCNNTGTFVNGGNGIFRPSEQNLVVIDCEIPNVAPEFDIIPGQVVDEGQPVEFSVSASDLNHDLLSYIANFLPTGATFIGQLFSWTTNSTQAGEYEVEFVVDDGELNDTMNLTFVVNNVNQLPYFDPVPTDIVIEEDSGTNLYGELSANDTDLDGSIVGFSVIDENEEQVDCEITEDGTLDMTPADDWEGVDAECTIEVEDNDGGTAETIIKINVTDVNDGPEITEYSPADEPILMAEDGSQLFVVEWEDIDNEGEVVVTWEVDGIHEEDGEEFTFNGLGVDGEYEIIVIVDDGEFVDTQEWTVTTSTIPVTTEYDGNTTDFSGMDDDDLTCVYLILEKVGEGKIEFSECVDLRDVVDLDKYTSIANEIGAIDSNFYPSFAGKSAMLTFYNLAFNKTPTIYYFSGFSSNPSQINVICLDSMCSNVLYDTGTLDFDITGFSSFMVGDAQTCSQQGGIIISDKELCTGELFEARDSNSCCSVAGMPRFSDIDLCEAINSRVEITIKEPDKGEDFSIGDEINVEVKIKNNWVADLEFDVEVHLYNLDEDESEEDVDDDSFDVDEGKSETIEFTIEIPEDLDDGDDYVIFVRVEDEDDDVFCNQDYVSINIEREKHKVIIESYELRPSIVNPGEYVDAVVKIKNVGTKDEDVYVTLENSELGILEQTEEFELEKYDDDDEEQVSLSARIPVDAEEKQYDFRVKVYFDNGDDSNSETEVVSVVKKGFTSGMITLGDGLSPIGGSPAVIDVVLGDSEDNDDNDDGEGSIIVDITPNGKAGSKLSSFFNKGIETMFLILLVMELLTIILLVIITVRSG